LPPSASRRLNRIGPHLNGIFDRKAGSIEGFRYSKDMLRQGADGLVWNFENLDVYLENPRSLISKTRMNFRGLKDPQDRADVIAYLRRFSSPAGRWRISSWPCTPTRKRSARIR